MRSADVVNLASSAELSAGDSSEEEEAQCEAAMQKPAELIALTADSDDDAAPVVVTAPPPLQVKLEIVADAKTEVRKYRGRAISHRQMRPQNNPQPKPLSRKPDHRARRKAVRDFKRIYYAKTMKTKLAQEYLNLPGFREALQRLRNQIADEDKPPALPVGAAVLGHTAEQQQVAEALNADEPATCAIAWPRSIDHSLEFTVAEGVLIKGYWPSDVCQCLVDCFSDDCLNTTSSLFCDVDNCTFGGRCSNGITECSAVELFQLAIGIGVRAADTIPVEATIAPYTGFLTDLDYDAEVHQRHYVISLHARSSNDKKLFIDAESSGTVARYINHSCEPNTEFVEFRHNRKVHVLVKTTEEIEPNEESTVDYGETWFTHACRTTQCRDPNNPIFG